MSLIEVLSGTYDNPSYDAEKASVLSKWMTLQSEFAGLKDQIEEAMNMENEFYENLEVLVEWLDAFQDIITSLKRSDSSSLFSEARSCFEVGRFRGS